MTCKVSTLSLLDFSKRVGDGFAIPDEEYIRLMKSTVPLEELPALSVDEATHFHMAVAWLYDYSLLLLEYKNQSSPMELEYLGMPCLPGASGPYIDNVLNRGDSDPDFSAVFTFGLDEVLAA